RVVRAWRQEAGVNCSAWYEIGTVAATATPAASLLRGEWSGMRAAAAVTMPDADLEAPKLGGLSPCSGTMDYIAALDGHSREPASARVPVPAASQRRYQGRPTLDETCALASIAKHTFAASSPPTRDQTPRLPLHPLPTHQLATLSPASSGRRRRTKLPRASTPFQSVTMTCISWQSSSVLALTGGPLPIHHHQSIWRL
ncbi:hypothetical protein K505DRAFT_82689, partial [Melanomma pulvis-pyrius CBS 109.77]